MVVERVKSLLNKGDKLLYLTEFGSHLYGTANENSDHDYKGIFLPSIENFYSNTVVESITISTGKNDSKNTKDDVDIQLYSLQYFIHKLLMNGDTSALDIAFSITNKDCILYQYNIPMESMGYDYLYPVMEYIIDNIDKILNLKGTNAYVGYCIGQAKKYGIKGSRLGVYKKIKEYLNKNRGIDDELDLEHILDDILDECYDKSYCFEKEQKGLKYLCINGSMHQYNITIKEFEQRIDKAIDSYGDRTKKALEDGGMDYKALSHAVRLLYQCEELYKDGLITFPIKQREEVLKIKNGFETWDNIEKTILAKLEDVDNLRENTKLNWKYNHKFCSQLIKELYQDNA